MTIVKPHILHHLIEEYHELTNELRNLTRIERLARRLPVQIRYINYAIDQTKGLDGVILELGLGDGRTLEYIEYRTSSQIFVFEIDDDKKLINNKESTKLVKGNFIHTIPKTIQNEKLQVRIVHADIGSTDYMNDLKTLNPLREIADNFVQVGGVVICDRPILYQKFSLLHCAHEEGWPYYLWKKVA